MYDTDGQLLREAWKASGQDHCPHTNCASERSFGGVFTGYSICQTCGMRLAVLHSETKVNKRANDHLLGEQERMLSQWNQRRASCRLTVKGIIVLERATFNDEGRLINVSIPGCGVESPMSVTVGDDLRLRLLLFNEEAEIYVPRAIVRWKNQMRFGLEFLVWEEADRLRLTQFIARGITVGV